MPAAATFGGQGQTSGRSALANRAVGRRLAAHDAPPLTWRVALSRWFPELDSYKQWSLDATCN